MLIGVSNLSKGFSGRELLGSCSFNVEKNDRCAIVGANGTGKTTLIKMITGELKPDSGTITIKAGTTLGYLSQLDKVSPENTILEELMSAKEDLINKEKEISDLSKRIPDLKDEELESALKRFSALQQEFEKENGYAVQSEITGVLKGLGFSMEEGEKRIDTLSGGQKTRVALGKILLKNPDLIILDEPTNHLDISSVEWLENYLRNYKGTLILVSHDRYFLDRIVNKVFAIENNSIRSYTGNYTDFSKKQKALRDADLKAYLKNTAEIKHQEEVIAKLKQFNREKSIKRAESREKLLSKIERLDRPTEDKEIRLFLSPDIESGNDVLSVEHLSKAFPGTPLFDDLSFEIKKGEKVALIGDNGTGKTTLLKILNKMVKPDSGFFRLGVNVHVGYYDQEQGKLHPEKTIFDEIRDDFPALNDVRIRTALASFLFTGELVYKEISSLSGGERGRVSLAKLMLSKANFLLLDEPTNHLDSESTEILEEALRDYTGTVFYVSHDRFFVNRTATRILDLENGNIKDYPGNYDYFLEKKNSILDAGNDAKETVAEKTQSYISYTEQKAEQARIRKKNNRIAKIEAEIDENEKRSSEIDELFEDPDIATDAVRLNELTEEKSLLEKRNEELLKEWEELQTTD